MGSVWGLYGGIRVRWRLHWDNGKENGNYHSGFRVYGVGRAAARAVGVYGPGDLRARLYGLLRCCKELKLSSHVLKKPF